MEMLKAKDAVFPDSLPPSMTIFLGMGYTFLFRTPAPVGSLGQAVGSFHLNAHVVARSTRGGW